MFLSSNNGQFNNRMYQNINTKKKKYGCLGHCSPFIHSFFDSCCIAISMQMFILLSQPRTDCSSRNEAFGAAADAGTAVAHSGNDVNNPASPMEVCLC